MLGLVLPMGAANVKVTAKRAKKVVKRAAACMMMGYQDTGRRRCVYHGRKSRKREPEPSILKELSDQHRVSS